jgi:hypothetical protein
MKKILLTLVLIPNLLFGQTFVSTVPEYKNVILEEYTGYYSSWDPAGHVIAESIKSSYPNDVFFN